MRLEKTKGDIRPEPMKETSKDAGMSDEEAELKGFCRKCGKAYPDEELKTEINIASDGWFEDYTLRCPKGHVIYFKD